MNNSQRIMVKIIREICTEQGILCESFSYDWILRLSKGQKVVHVYGYQFENNSAAAQLICTDKCATSELLLSKGIPAVRHHFFIHPDDLFYIGSSGNWQRMLDLLKKYEKIVVKPNEGTGGMDVYRAATPSQLETAAARIFSRYKSLAISPFLNIEQEYRVILLGQETKLIYSKQVPYLTGDGQSTIRQLKLKMLQDTPEMMSECEWDESDSTVILPKGERAALTWKHNLGQGASPEIINNPALAKILSSLAVQAASVVNVNFASVDIIKVNNNYQVLEINSGIMMESFARQNQQNYQRAKDIYSQALSALFLTK